MKLIPFILKKKKTPEPFYLKDNPKYSKYNIGKGTYGRPKVYDWNEGTTLTIGKYCSIADQVNILLGGNHQDNWVTTYPFATIHDYNIIDHKSKGNVIIGNDVWIGFGSCILSGVVIGDGAIIGARSVVLSNVEEYSVVGGNPAKHIRYRFSKEKIKLLKDICWWDWPEEKIKKNYNLLLSAKIEELGSVI